MPNQFNQISTTMWRFEGQSFYPVGVLDYPYSNTKLITVAPVQSEPGSVLVTASDASMEGDWNQPCRKAYKQLSPTDFLPGDVTPTYSGFASGGLNGTAVVMELSRQTGESAGTVVSWLGMGNGCDEQPDPAGIRRQYLFENRAPRGIQWLDQDHICVFGNGPEGPVLENLYTRDFYSNQYALMDSLGSQILDTWLTVRFGPQMTLLANADSLSVWVMDGVQNTLYSLPIQESWSLKDAQTIGEEGGRIDLAYLSCDATRCELSQGSLSSTHMSFEGTVISVDPKAEQFAAARIDNTTVYAVCSELYGHSGGHFTWVSKPNQFEWELTGVEKIDSAFMVGGNKGAQSVMFSIDASGAAPDACDRVVETISDKSVAQKAERTEPTVRSDMYYPETVEYFEVSVPHDPVVSKTCAIDPKGQPMRGIWAEPGGATLFSPVAQDASQVAAAPLNLDPAVKH